MEKLVTVGQWIVAHKFELAAAVGFVVSEVMALVPSAKSSGILEWVLKEANLIKSEQKAA